MRLRKKALLAAAALGLLALSMLSCTEVDDSGGSTAPSTSTAPPATGGGSSTPAPDAVADSLPNGIDGAAVYAAANCAMCHRPNGPADLPIDLRFKTKESKMGIFDLPPQRGTLGIEEAKIISSGDRERSVLLQRMHRHDEFRMPPVGSNSSDEAALRLLGNWIDIRIPR